MGVELSWVALGLGGVALAHSVLHAVRMPRADTPTLTPLLGAAAALVVAAGLLTIPTRPPWSPGQTLIHGLIAGGLAVLVAVFVAARLSGMGQRGWFAGAAAGTGASTVAVAALLAVYPRTALYTSTGFALGAMAAGLVIAGGLCLAGATDAEAAVADAAERATLIAVALGGSTFLAVFHRSPTGVREWQSLPALLTATLAAGLAIRAVLARGDDAQGSRADWLRSLLAVVVPVVAMAWLIAYRLNGSHGFFNAVWMGLAAYGLVAWLEANSAAPAGSPGPGLVAALIVLGEAALVFRERHGIGLGVSVLGGLALAGLVPRAGVLLRGALAMGTLLALYRVFEEKVGYTRSPEPDFFYYHAALVLGALLPAVLAGALSREGEARAPLAGAVLRVGAAGLVAAAAPLAVWVLIGPRPLAAFVLGLGIGAAFLLAGESGKTRAGGLLGLAMALSAIQFTHLLQPLELWTRTGRIGLLAGVGVVVLVLGWASRKVGVQKAVPAG